jgi:hypothetical protein
MLVVLHVTVPCSAHMHGGIPSELVAHVELLLSSVKASRWSVLLLTAAVTILVTVFASRALNHRGICGGPGGHRTLFGCLHVVLYLN